MNVGVFSFTADMPALETGVTTYSRVLLKALCGFGSDDRYYAYLSKGNARRFADLDFPNLRKIDMDPEFFKTKMMEFKYLRSIGMLAFGFLMNKNRFLCNILNRIYAFHLPQEYGLDLLIYTSYGAFPHIPLFVGFSESIPLVSVIHDARYIIYRQESIRTRTNFLYTRLLVENSALVVVPTSFVKEKVMDYCKVPESKIRVLFSIPEINSRREESVASLNMVRERFILPPKFLFFPSMIADVKNHLTLVKAMRILKDKGVVVSLVMSGTITDRKLFEEIMRQVSELGLTEDVRHVGFVSEEEKVALYKLATCLIMPSVGESWSLPIWESFYLDCPVVASNAFDLPEQIGNAGLLFDPFNVEDMAEKIYAIWTDEQLRQELVKKGYERVKSFALSDYARHWQGIIKEAVERSKE